MEMYLSARQEVLFQAAQSHDGFPVDDLTARVGKASGYHYDEICDAIGVVIKNGEAELTPMRILILTPEGLAKTPI